METKTNDTIKTKTKFLNVVNDLIEGHKIKFLVFCPFLCIDLDSKFPFHVTLQLMSM